MGLRPVNAEEIIKELEEVLKKHNATLSADNMGELILEINNKFVAFGTIINGHGGITTFEYLEK